MKKSAINIFSIITLSASMYVSTVEAGGMGMGSSNSRGPDSRYDRGPGYDQQGYRRGPGYGSGPSERSGSGFGMGNRGGRDYGRGAGYGPGDRRGPDYGSGPSERSGSGFGMGNRGGRDYDRGAGYGPGDRRGPDYGSGPSERSGSGFGKVVPALVWVTGVAVTTDVVLDTVLVRITSADLVPVPSLAANEIQAFLGI